MKHRCWRDLVNEARERQQHQAEPKVRGMTPEEIEGLASRPVYSITGPLIITGQLELGLEG